MIPRTSNGEACPLPTWRRNLERLALSASLCLLVIQIGCAAPTNDVPAAAAVASRPPIDLVDHRLVDLSHTYDADTVYWPTSPSAFDLERLAWGDTEGGYFYAANTLCTPEHGGTHLDAPIHFAAERWTTEQVPLERLIGPAVVLDVGAQADADADYRLAPEDVAVWESSHGLVPEGAIVLLRTGWSQRWPDGASYLGGDPHGDATDLHFPSYGEAAARLLIEQRGVSMLGVDTASIDHGPSSDFVVHRIANDANVPGLENVANLEQLPASGAWVIALPMKIGGGSGAPVRIVALVPRSQ